MTFPVLVQAPIPFNGDGGGHLYFHMGMTGRISTPQHIPKLESLSDNDSYPPPHTHLILKSKTYEIAYSDPRKFGAVCLVNHNNDTSTSNLEKQWGEFAMDALDAVKVDALGPHSPFHGFIDKARSVKTLLLDQRAVISGIGNWIAVETRHKFRK